MKDEIHQWHHTYAADANAKPMFLGLSGTTIAAFFAAILVSMVGLFIMTQLLNFRLLPSLVVAAVVPALNLGVLLHFYANKPKNYAARWVESHRIKKSNSPLLSHLSDDENSQSTR